MSIVVLIFHLAWEIFGIKFSSIHSGYFNFLLDGPLAVYIFFILSGDALSNGYILRKNRRLLSKLIIKRYFRLTGPILISCTIVYCLMKFSLTFNKAASSVVSRDDWLGSFLPFHESIFRMLEYAILGVYTNNSINNSYNPFLWPMATELYGSFFIFRMLCAFDYIKKPLLICLLAAGYLWILGSFYSLFFIGLSLSILRSSGYFEKINKLFNSSFALIGILLIALSDSFFGSVNHKPPQVSIFLATVFVFLTYSSKSLRLFFSNSISNYLGKISFPLYISHFSVIISYTSWIIVYYEHLGLLDAWHSVFIVLSSILIAVFVADMFSRLESLYLLKLDLMVDKLLNK